MYTAAKTKKKENTRNITNRIDKLSERILGRSNVSRFLSRAPVFNERRGNTSSRKDTYGF